MKILRFALPLGRYSAHVMRATGTRAPAQDDRSAQDDRGAQDDSVSFLQSVFSTLPSLDPLWFRLRFFGNNPHCLFHP